MVLQQDVTLLGCKHGIVSTVECLTKNEENWWRKLGWTLLHPLRCIHTVNCTVTNNYQALNCIGLRILANICANVWWSKVSRYRLWNKNDMSESGSRVQLWLVEDTSLRNSRALMTFVFSLHYNLFMIGRDIYCRDWRTILWAPVTVCVSICLSVWLDSCGVWKLSLDKFRIRSTHVSTFRSL